MVLVIPKQIVRLVLPIELSSCPDSREGTYTNRKSLTMPFSDRPKPSFFSEISERSTVSRGLPPPAALVLSTTSIPRSLLGTIPLQCLLEMVI